MDHKAVARKLWQTEERPLTQGERVLSSVHSQASDRYVRAAGGLLSALEVEL